MTNILLLDALEYLKKGENQDPDHVWQNIENAIIKALVPQVTVGNERPCEVMDFNGYLSEIETVLKHLVLVFRQIVTNVNITQVGGCKVINKHRAVNLLVLCGEHSGNEKWTTEETVKHSEELATLLCELWQCKSVVEILTGVESKPESVGLFSPALLFLRPKLLKETWKTYPAAVSSYMWLLFKVKSPHLSPHLNSVLPTALIIMDDFVSENRIYGIKCLDHITHNVTRTELGWHGHSDVIYKALEPLLYQGSADMVRPLVSCLITVLGKVEGGYKNEPDYVWSRYDDVLQKLLVSMEMEEKLALRLAYIQSLPALLEASGIRMVRWSNCLLRVFQRYLEVAGFSEHSEARHTLLAIQVFLRHCWPFVPARTQVLLQMLLRLLCDITVKEETGGELDVEEKDVVMLVEECLSMIVKIAPEESEILCKDIKTRARFNETMASVIDKVFE